MSDGDLDDLVATMQARTRRIQWLWGLGMAWLTLWWTGAVVLLLWVR